MPGAQPRKDPDARVMSQLARQATGSPAPGSVKV
jgi:hypothetical protein